MIGSIGATAAVVLMAIGDVTGVGGDLAKYMDAKGSGKSDKPTKTLSEEPFSPDKMEFGCEDVAKAVQEEIGGQIYKITSKIKGVKSIGSVKYGGGQVSGWAYHVAVIKDGIVYDGLTGSNGMPEELYKLMFEFWDVLDFTPN